MIKKWGCLILFSMVFTLDVQAIDIYDFIQPANPIEKEPSVFVPNDLKRATLTKNDVRNQYEIALNRYIQSNVKSSYTNFKMLIETATPSDYMYLNMSEKMAELGFFDLSKESANKLKDNDIADFLIEDVKKFYFPSVELTKNDQLYLAEMYSNIVYNDQSREVVQELLKVPNLLQRYDYANYIAALGYFKSNNMSEALKYVNVAISKNQQNINYQKLKAEILSQTSKQKDALKIVQKIKSQPMLTTHFIDKVNSTQEYVLYKTKKNEFEKKYHLAYYFYLEDDLNKSMRTLQTAFSTQKNNNKNVYALLSRVYYELKEYEKAEDNATKACKLDKSNEIALKVLGDLAYRKKNYSLAIKYYGSANAYESLAEAYEKLGNVKKAYDIYAKILKTHSDSYLAYYHMALLDKSREIEYLKKSIAINYEFKDGWIDLARCAIERSNFDLASSYLSIVKSIDENDFRYYYYLGLIYKNNGLTADAKRNFMKSININPDFMPAKKELSI